MIKIHDVQTVSTGKIKQDVIIADDTGSCVLTLWEDNIDKLEEQVSYQLNRFQVHRFQGKSEIIYPQYGSSVNVIPDLKDVSVELPSQFTYTNLTKCTIEGVQQLTTIYTCVASSCKVSIEPESEVAGNHPKGTCKTCGTIQKLKHPRKTARLFIKNGENEELWLRAYSEVLNNIMGTTKFDAEDLMDVPPFNLVYNQYYVITSVNHDQK